MSRVLRFLSFVLMLPLCAAMEANATCVPDGSPEELQECALRQLILQDDATQKLYQQLMEALPVEGKLKLESEQASWQNGRESRCEKLVMRSAKSKLPIEIQHTGCLISLSERRAKQLKQRLLRQAPNPSIEWKDSDRPSPVTHVER